MIYLHQEFLIFHTCWLFTLNFQCTCRKRAAWTSGYNTIKRVKIVSIFMIFPLQCQRESEQETHISHTDACGGCEATKKKNVLVWMYWRKNLIEEKKNSPSQCFPYGSEFLSSKINWNRVNNNPRQS